MTIKVLDGSNYFRGLLLLIRKDRTLADQEVALMKPTGKALGFETEFCDNAIREILHNDYVSDTVPKFSSLELAEKFISDGLTIAFADGEIHPLEEEWLRAAAEKNGLTCEWFRQRLENARGSMTTSLLLEAESLTVTHQWTK